MRESLQSYYSASKKQQKRMSDVLSYGDESAVNKTADSPSFYHQTSHAQKQFRPTSTITTPPVKSSEISDNAATNVQSGSFGSCIVSASGNRISVPPDSGLTTVPRTHTNPNPAEFVSMFAGGNINNCVFQFSQNPVHGMPSSLSAITDNDHQAPTTCLHTRL